MKQLPFLGTEAVPSPAQRFPGRASSGARGRSPGSSRRQAGFTLTELLVVIALIGLAGVFALPRISSMLKISLGSSTREIAAVVKDAYNAAVMTGRVYRLVYNLKDNQYWVESGPNTYLLDTTESKEKEERRKRWAKVGEKEPPSAFQLDKRVTRAKKSLPDGVMFEDVVTEQSTEPIREGIAYTHFFPHGLAEQTLIHLRDTSEHHISLVITPVVGRTRVVDRRIEKIEEAYE